jgi:peroxiredoxin
MRHRWLFALLVLIVIAGAIVLVIRPDHRRVEVGARAPDFTATDLRTGKAVSLYRDYRGAVTLVNVWATWCGPCRQEMPAMDSLYRALGPRGFRIAAVSIDSASPDVVRNFVKEYAISFDVLHDPRGDIESHYQVTGYPESFLVDRSGHIVRIAMLSTPWNSAENRRIISELLAAPAS